jgi:hypothetical protein
MHRNSVQQTTNTAGGGAYQLTGTITTKGVVPFAVACTSGKKYRYRVERANTTDFELNEGTFTSGAPSTLTRDRLIQSSTGGPIVWPDASDKIITLVAIGEDFGPEGGRHDYLAAAGTANVVTAASDTPAPVLVAGMRVAVKVAITNTGAATFNLNALGAKAIKKDGVTLDVEAGDLVQNAVVEMRYEQTADVWVLLNPRIAGATGLKVIATNTYNIVAADVGKLLIFTHASGCAVALPQATGAFIAPWWVEIQNASGGAVVVTPATSTIDGVASISIPINNGAEIRSDSTNYRTRRDTVPTVVKTSNRQTVLSSTVDADGFPNFISIGSGLSVNIDAAPTPLVLTAANGAAADGTTDRIGIQSADTTITALTANQTNYLFADIAADGTITFGKTTIAPAYQFGGAYSTTNGAFTFNISEMVGKLGNGSAANQTYRVYIGEAVCGASTVTSVVNYALRGVYQSPWTATLPALSTTVAFAHKIGTMEIHDTGLFEIECTTTNNGYGVGERIQNPHLSGGGAYMPVMASLNDRNTATVAAGSTGGWYSPPKGGGGTTLLTGASFKYRFKLKRNW